MPHPEPPDLPMWLPLPFGDQPAARSAAELVCIAAQAAGRQASSEASEVFGDEVTEQVWPTLFHVLDLAQAICSQRLDAAAGHYVTQYPKAFAVCSLREQATLVARQALLDAVLVAAEALDEQVAVQPQFAELVRGLLTVFLATGLEVLRVGAPADQMQMCQDATATDVVGAGRARDLREAFAQVDYEIPHAPA